MRWLRSAFSCSSVLIVIGCAVEWWRLLRGTKPIVSHESEFVPLSAARSGGELTRRLSGGGAARRSPDRGGGE